MKYRVGVIGLGQMGRNHLRALSEMSNVEVVGIVEIDSEARKLASSNSLFMETIEDLAQQAPSYVVVATPIRTHFGIAQQLIDLGVNSLVEKTVTSDASECKELIELSEAKSVKVFAAHVERYNACCIKLKELLKQKEVGKVFSILTIRRGPKPIRVLDVDVLQDIGIHDIDLVRWFLSDEYGKCDSRGLRSEIDGRLEYVLLRSEMRYSSVIVSNEFSWISPVKQRTIEVFGEEGYIHADLMSQEITVTKSELTAPTIDPGLVRVRGGSTLRTEVFSLMAEEPLLRQHKEVQRRLSGDAQASVVTLQEALQSAKVLEEASLLMVDGDDDLRQSKRDID